VLKSAVILRASGARLRIAEFAGLRHWASLWAANRLVYARRPHEVERCLEVAGPLGVRLGPPRFCLHIPAEARAWAAQQLSGRPRPRLAINLGSARPEKRWPPENFAAVVAGLKAALGETTVILTGTQAEGQVAEAVAQAAPESCLTLAGQTTLPQLAAVLEACDLLLTADSGPMHMMAALGKPVIALFGPTDPRRNGPWGDQHKVLCAPDGRMTSLSAQTVLAALLEQWAAVRPG
jgi:heptosyltransferase-1